jgi:diguanylate cyclase (GGDEF)-like protein
MDRMSLPNLATELIRDVRFGLDQTRRLLAIGVLAAAAVLFASISETDSQLLMAVLIAFSLVMIAAAGKWTSIGLVASNAKRSVALETALGTLLLGGMVLLLTVQKTEGRDAMLAIGAVGLGSVAVARGLSNGADRPRLDQFVMRATGLALVVGVIVLVGDADLSTNGSVLLVTVPMLAAYLSLAGSMQDVLLRTVPLVAVGIRLAIDPNWLPLLVIVAGVLVLADMQRRRPLISNLPDESRQIGVTVWICCVGVCCLAATLFQHQHLPIYFALSAVAVITIGSSGYLHHLAEQSRRLHSTEQDIRQLREIADLDDLTGLPMRGALMRRLTEEVERSVRYRQPMCVCFIDIDHFKDVNDRYGHATGDRVLAQVGGLIHSTIRTPDFVARYGGEEFVVIAPATWSEDARILASRIQRQLQAEQFPGMEASVTISVGIAGVPEHGATVETVLDRADHALYAAKFGGRNRVEIALDLESDPA